ncbi:MAG: twin-arginine translocation signal domain-containing protein [Armatimonadetes bacterium]|nr:twin-arginine translocation signal domain-containing protein [Armatimonadota bacterium]
MPRECECAGPCGPPAAGISRRDFFTLAGAGTAAAILGGPAWANWVEKKGTGKEQERWKAGLFQDGPKRIYRSGVHTDVRFPLGGIGTGNFELGVDGQFTTWQLFNTLRDGHIPFFFAVKAGETAKLLQTRGGPDWNRIRAIEMTGEYPFATLNFVDADLPVRVQMTAFTPFAPLDSRLSSMPLAGFRFKISNPTSAKQTVSLGAFMQNPVGYDATGVPISFNSVGFNAVPERMEPRHPNFGGNYNRVRRQGNGTALLMEAESGSRPTLDQPVVIYTNANPDGLITPPNDRPENLTVLGIDRLSGEGTGSEAGSKRIIWLEDPAADLSSESLQRIRDAVEAGATLVFSGSTMPLLDLYGQTTKGKPLASRDLRSDLVFEDFEGGYGEWEVEGEAFGKEPATGTLPNQQAVSGFAGRGLVNTFRGGDAPKGRLRSKPFKVERNYIRFLVGGGSHAGTQIRLLVDGKTVRAASGQNQERLLPAVWDVREFAGPDARIEIVDEESGPWGHINVDQIEFTDLPASLTVLNLLEELLPLRFSAVRPSPKGEGRVEFVGQEEVSRITWSKEDRSGRRVTRRTVGNGSVILADGPIMSPAHAEWVGARQRAYAVLGTLAGVDYTPPEGVLATAPGYGALALVTLGPNATALTAFEEWETAWKSFAQTGRFEEVSGTTRSLPSPAGKTVNGALAATVELDPGETVEIPFFLAWRYPNRYAPGREPIGNHYARLWEDIDTLAREAAERFGDLYAKTEQFRQTFYDSTLPYWLLDCLTSQISTIRHAGVVFRIANSDIYGWEGSNGCCPPTCTHVWGYEQTLSRLFPDLEREMRRIDYFHQQREDGGINNRTAVPSPPHPTGEHPFADGHSSCILKAYREALNHPDESWLRRYWPRIRRGVEYLIDRDAKSSGGTPDGTISDDQWNTYDNAIHGVNTFIGTYYLAALRAGEEMARRMGERETAGRYHTIFERGRKKLVEQCWNGEYFVQNLPGYLERAGEYGPGCLSDQLIGQWWAHQLGLGEILPGEQTRKALASIYRYNWLADFTGFEHNWRKFAGGNDRGLLNCTWPKGGRPALTIPYVDEVWTGVEYQVAGHMIYEGMIEEAFAIVKGARDRYDGIPRPPIPRNPWNEIECGGHYVRAMASWALLLALSGFEYDGPEKRMAVAPRLTPENFKAFFTGPEGWGSLKQTRKGGAQQNEIAMVEGRLTLSRLQLKPTGRKSRVRVSVADRAVPAKLRRRKGSVEVVFEEPLTLEQGETLRVALS